MFRRRKKIAETRWCRSDGAEHCAFVSFFEMSRGLVRPQTNGRAPQRPRFASRGRGALFAKDSYLNLLFSVSTLIVHVNIDGEFVELVDEVLEIIGLDLVDIEGNTLLDRKSVV